VRKSSEYLPYVKLITFLEKGEELVASARKMCSRAQWEIKMIAWYIWRELLSLHPRAFKYTELGVFSERIECKERSVLSRIT